MLDIIDGRYYSNGEKNLYVKITGEGENTIVIEPGLGGLSAEWSAIQDALSQYATVISYDRAGYGESPNGTDPRTSMQIVDELFNTLQNVNPSSKITFLSHAEGALYSVHFARMYPNFVAGLVLVDPRTEHDLEINELDTPVFKERASTQARMNGIKKYLDLDKDAFEKSVQPLLTGLYPDFPDPIQHQLVMYQSDLNLYGTIVKEYEAWEESVEQIKWAGRLMDFPMKVLCRDGKVMVDLAKSIGIPEAEAQAVEDKWLDNCNRLAAQSTEADVQVVADANHNIYLSNPKLIYEAVLDVLSRI